MLDNGSRVQFSEVTDDVPIPVVQSIDVAWGEFTTNFSPQTHRSCKVLSQQVVTNVVLRNRRLERGANEVSDLGRNHPRDEQCEIPSGVLINP